MLKKFLVGITCILILGAMMISLMYLVSLL